MVEKTKVVFKLVLIIFMMFAVVYSLVLIILSIFREPNIVSSDEVQLYTIDSNVVTRYQTYYYIESCFENLVEGVRQGKLDEVYKLYLDDYKEQYTKEEVYAKLNEFSINNKYKLEKVYTADGTYILEYKLNSKVEYLFMQIGVSKSESYNFAFVK